MDKLLRWRWAPLVLALAWLALTAWARPLALPDEGRYTGVAWAMLTGGDWLTPQLNGLPYFHKPPLFYWITAGSMALFGPHEWAARAAPLLGAALGVTALFLFARRWFGEREARLALVAAATQPLVFLGGQFANLDMLVAGCIGATVLAFAHAALLQAQGQRARPALAAGYLFAALGVLAKGLIGIVLPGMVLVIWLLLRRDVRGLWRLLWLPGIALFLAVAAPWFVLMQQRFPEFFHYFFVVQHFARYAQGGFNNQQPVLFYPVVLLLLALPWSLWMLAGARPRLLAEPTRGSLRLLLWLWAAVIVGFFSLPKSKLVGYVLPATWPLALLAADAFAASTRASASRWWRASAAAAALICVGVVAGVSLHDGVSTRLIAQALRRGAQPGDPVVYLHGAFFDVPFYARLARPAFVVEDWDDPKIAVRDNWRRELADAGRFDAAAAQHLLIKPRALPEVACSAATVWFIGASALPARYPLLREAQPIAQQRGATLWRLAPAAPGVSRPGCPGTPNAS